MPASAREVILQRVTQALGGSSTPEQARAAWESIPRTFRRSATLAPDRLLHLLIDRLLDYDAQVFEAHPLEVLSTIEQALSARGVRRLILPPGFPAGLLPEGFDFATDDGRSPSDLNTFDGVLTMATLAIAETGTIVLQNKPGQGRRITSLVPDYHLCIVDAESIVENVPQAIERLQLTATLPTTFISGPSATADIEMTRIKGVHGPRFLDVLLVV